MVTENQNDNEDLFNRFFVVKKHIYSFLNKKELLKLLVENIEENGHIKFVLESDKRFLNFNQLSLNLTLTEKALEDFPSLKMKNSKDKKFEEERRNFIYQKINEPLMVIIQYIFLIITNRFTEEDEKQIPFSLITKERIAKILPNMDYSQLIQSVNNFTVFSEDEQETISDNFQFIFNVCSSVTFPLSEETDFNEDRSFTMEIIM